MNSASSSAAAAKSITTATVGRTVRGAELRRALWYATTAWIFGSVWLTAVSGTPFTSFAKSLKASEFQFGLLSALPFIASLASLPASLLIEATGQRKRIFFWGLYFQRLMWIPIAVFPVLLMHLYGVAGSRAAIVMFLWLVFFMHCGNAIGGPAWVSWMADLVPDRKRGKYFSRRRQWGVAAAIPTAFIVGHLLDRYATGNGTQHALQWYGGVFCVAALFGLVDIAMFHPVPEIHQPPQRGIHLFHAWREPLRNPRFLWFAAFVATLMFAISFMGQFVTLYVMRQLGGADGKAGTSVNMLTQLMLIVAPAVAQLLVLPVWGRAADRMGKRPLLIIAGLGLVPVGFGWCFVTPHLIWLGYLLSAAGAALWAGVEIGNFNIVLEMVSSDGNGGADQPTKGRTAYVAVNGVIINIAGCLGGLSAGALAQWLRDWQFHTAFKTFMSYDVLFALSAVLRLAAVVVFLPHIHEPQSKPTREALRFMTTNIYNNLFAAIMQPLRSIKLTRKETYQEAQETL